MNPLDDGSNASLVVAFVSAALIGGISLTLYTLWQLRRYDRADDTGLAGSVVTGPWTGSDRPGDSWQEAER